MKKFYKLKKWLTIDEAAHGLGIELGEKVTNADVLELWGEEKFKV